MDNSRPTLPARGFSRIPEIMSSGTVANRLNLEVIEAAYERWRQDPEAVDLSWRFFFEGFELGAAQSVAVRPSRRTEERWPDGDGGGFAPRPGATTARVRARRKIKEKFFGTNSCHLSFGG